ncbi:MAG: hypothetical protein GY851_26125 [bacterium]|nr:hypothetical protein [bacterium]
MRANCFHAVSLVVAVLIGFAAAAEQMSIPKTQIDEKKIFWGSSADFSNPAEVNYEKVVQATPEYKALKKKKLQRGTGKYWILMTQASERSVKAIRSTGEKQGYDLVCSAGYLGSLDPAVPADDITKDVLKAAK